MRSEYRRYDPRLRNLVANSGDLERFAKLGIPLSTLRQWIKNGAKDFFTLPEFEMDNEELVKEILSLKQQLAESETKHDLTLKTFRIFDFQIQYARLPSASAKERMLATIKAAANVIGQKSCLEVIDLSTARYHHWRKRQVKCELTDEPNCPKVSLLRLTAGEVLKIKELFTSKRFFHYSICQLSWRARKTGEVAASPSTWSRDITQLGLTRDQKRVYPPKPKIGIRASAPGQLWHLDQSIIKAQDGTKAYVQAVIDNFSRYVLAWKATSDYGGARTKDLLLKALKKSKELGL